MSLDATRWAWVQKIKPTMKLILLSLADRSDENHCCYPSISRIANDTCLDRKTVMVGIKRLEDCVLIEARKKHGIGNFYQLKGVKCRHGTSTENRTGTNIGTSTKNGTTPVPQTGLVPVPKTGHESTIESTNNLPSDLDPELFKDFLDLRKKLKAQNTDRAMKLLFVEIEKIRAMGQDPNKAIENSILKGWKTVYPFPVPKTEFLSYGEGGI